MYTETTTALKTATRITYTEVTHVAVTMSLRNPETGEFEDVPTDGIEVVPTGKYFHRYFPVLGSSWIYCLDWTPSYVAGRGTLTVRTRDGRTYTHRNVASITLVNILRGCRYAKSTKKRSVGATYRYFFPAAKAATVPNRRTVQGNRVANAQAFYGPIRKPAACVTAWTRPLR